MLPFARCFEIGEVNKVKNVGVLFNFLARMFSYEMNQRTASVATLYGIELSLIQIMMI